MFPTDGTFDPSPVHLPLEKGRGRKTTWRAAPPTRSPGPPAPRGPRPSLHALLRAAAAALGLALCAALVAYAAWPLPGGLLLAWPLYAVAAAPSLLVTLAGALIRRSGELQAPLPQSAAQWLRTRIARLGLVHVQVEQVGALGLGSFYHPSSHIIGLAHDVHDEHTVLAHATAAHELGHAWIDRHAPRRARLAMWARTHSGTLFHGGASLLFSAAMLGERALLPAAFALCGAALLAHVAVVLEEAAASLIGLRELTATGLGGAERAQAWRYLASALVSYLANSAGLALPLVLAPTLGSFFGDGLLRPGPAMSDLHALVLGSAAVAVLLVAAILALAAFVVFMQREDFREPGAGASIVGGLGATAAVAMTLLAWNQPVAQAAPLAAALATTLLWPLVFWPVSGAMRLLAALLSTAATSPPTGTSAVSAVRLLSRLRGEQVSLERKLLRALWVLAPALPLALALLRG